MSEYEYFSDDDIKELLGTTVPDDGECLEHGKDCNKEED